MNGPNQDTEIFISFLMAKPIVPNTDSSVALIYVKIQTKSTINNIYIYSVLAVQHMGMHEH